MSDINGEALESTQDTLMEMFQLLLKAGNHEQNPEKIKRFKEERTLISSELDRIDIAMINSHVLPQEIQQAIDELNVMTSELKKEKERIIIATERLKEIDAYINDAKKILEISGKLFPLI
jgi:hypothetical protein